MRRWPLLAMIPLALLLAVCVSQPGTSGEDAETEEAKPAKEAEQESPATEPAEEKTGTGPFTLPWAPRKIADTIQDLSCPDWAIRRDAIRRVVGAGRWMVPFLLVALKNPDPQNRMEAAYCLGRIGDPVSVPSLVEVLEQDPAYDVIVYVTDALGRIGDPQAAGAIEPLLDYSLERAIYGREVGPIETKMIVSREATVRHAAAEALALLGDNQGIPLLIEGLTGNGWIRRDAAVRLRRLTGCKVDFGFHTYMTQEQNRKAREAWSAWWEANREGFAAERAFSRDALDVYMPRKEAGPGEGR